MLTQEKIQNIIKIAETKIEEATKIIEEMKALQNECKAPYGRAEEGEGYYFTTSSGCVYTTWESHSRADDDRYNIGNYYLTEAEVEKASKQITLFRILDRFSRENGWDDKLWENAEELKFCISRDYFDINKEIGVDYFMTAKCQGIVYFKTREIAEQAIEKFRELLEEVL